MGPNGDRWLLFAIASLLTVLAKAQNVYIVHMDTKEMPTPYTNQTHWYKSLSPKKVLYKYTTVLQGFAAVLSDSDTDDLKGKRGVRFLRLQSSFTLQTSRTPAFLNLTYEDHHRGVHTGEGVIVGLVDTGVWPESRSFADIGMSPPPPRWKGRCIGKNFKCNNKIIGARIFNRAAKAGGLNSITDSVRDIEGHGTHTASTAAGSEVKGASVFGFAYGTARGMAPKAWLAIYKTCWDTENGTCFGADVLAGIDAAVKDGVDVLSLSLGGALSDVPFFNDTIAISTLGAAKRGVFVACSAGNQGPEFSTVRNSAPWITTVGSSTLDRKFPAAVVLGNGDRLVGESLTGSTPGGMLALFYAGNETMAGFCVNGTLNPKDVRGKIVLCDRGFSGRNAKAAVVKTAGGVGMILGNDGTTEQQTFATAHVIPASHVGFVEAEKIRKYIVSRKAKAKAKIVNLGTILGVRPAPSMNRFSSRGPSSIVKELLKPDLTAPGHNILAAWPPIVSPTMLPSDKRRVDFNIISGTSMSCPHVAGVAAVIKSMHPHWSHAAVRSAMMTTASTVANDGRQLTDVNGDVADSFAYGAGHVDAHRALDPGLVYDLEPPDYDRFLCSLNYTRAELELLNGAGFECTERLRSLMDFNYPSFVVTFSKDEMVVRASRTLMNINEVKGVYKVRVMVPPIIKVVVQPNTLVFSKKGEKLNYIVRFSATTLVEWPLNSLFGTLVWESIAHSVRSPIAFSVAN